MNTGIAQLVAVTAHGNAALHRLVTAANLNESPLFRHVSSLAFATAPGTGGDSCAGVSEWFESFRSRGITRFRFVRLSGGDDSLDGPNRTASANGEQSAVAAIGPGDAMELWVPDWQTAPGEKGWVLTYRGYTAGPWSDHWNGEPVPVATEKLATALREIAEFARRQDLAHWADNFDGAHEILGDPAVPPTMDLLPDAGYSDAARRLLAGALSSWVFGGMGSWNDTGPRDADQYPRYEALTAQLYDALMNGLVSAANAFDPTIR